MSKPEKAPTMNKPITGLGDLRTAVEGKGRDVCQAAASEQARFCPISRRGAQRERKPPPMVRTSRTAGRKANNQVHPQYRGSRKECQAYERMVRAG